MDPDIRARNEHIQRQHFGCIYSHGFDSGYLCLYLDYHKRHMHQFGKCHCQLLCYAYRRYRRQYPE